MPEDKQNLTPEERIAASKERRERAREDRDNEELEQAATDLEAIEELEKEHGEVRAIRVAFAPGQPTRAVFRCPTRPEYKRYNDAVSHAVQAKRPKDLREAQEQLARSVWVYPRTREERDSMLEHRSGLLTSIAVAAAKMAEGKEEDEGKD